MEEVKVSKQDLQELYTEAVSIVQRLQQMILAEVGCLHRNKLNITTMGGSDEVQKYFCPDCGVTFEGTK